MKKLETIILEHKQGTHTHAHMNTCSAGADWHNGPLAHWPTGTHAHMHTGTQAHWHTGTLAHRHTGTLAHRHTGTQACKCINM